MGASVANLSRPVARPGSARPAPWRALRFRRVGRCPHGSCGTSSPVSPPDPEIMQRSCPYPRISPQPYPRIRSGPVCRDSEQPENPRPARSGRGPSLTGAIPTWSASP